MDISLVSTDEMLDELSKRFDALVVCGIKNLTDKNDSMVRHYSGNTMCCLGAIQVLNDCVLQGLYDQCEE